MKCGNLQDGITSRDVEKLKTQLMPNLNERKIRKVILG